VGDEEYVRSCGWVVVSDVRDADLILARGTFTVPTTVGDDGGGGVVRKEEDEEGYERALKEVLEVAAGLRIPMLVSNPDKVRPDKDLSPMPGSIGDSYEALLASAATNNGEEGVQLVKRIGKPFPEVYDLAFQLVDDDGNSSGDRLTSTIMVGDALETDVTGGIRAGCATLWVTQDGIHATAIDEAKGGKDGKNSNGYEEGIQAVIRGYDNGRRNSGGGGDDGEFISPTYVTPHFRW